MNKLEDKGSLTKTLASLGTILVWLPILAPVFFTVMRLVRTGFFMFDFLMPAELFILVLAGAGLLLWAAIRARAWVRWIGWSTGLAIGCLVASIAIAVFTGMASGETEAAGWRFTLALALMAGYLVMLVALGVGGVLLMLNLFRPST